MEVAYPVETLQHTKVNLNNYSGSLWGWQSKELCEEEDTASSISGTNRNHADR